MNVLKRLSGNMSDIPTAAVDRPLSAKAQELKAQHYAEYAQALEDRDRALERVAAADEACAKASHRISGLAEENAFLKKRIEEQEAEFKSRVVTYQIERDAAVVKTAALEKLLSVIKRAIDAETLPEVTPNVPVIDFSEVIGRVPAPKPPSPNEMLTRIK